MMKSTLVMMCGLPASGKTTAAGCLFRRFGGVLVRSCDIYQELGIVVSEWVRHTRGFSLHLREYDRVRDEAYLRMEVRVDAALTNGCPWVIVDFAHPELAKRRTLYKLARHHGATLAVVLCRCDDLEEVKRRFSARRGREMDPEHEASDLAVFRDIKRRWQNPISDPLPHGIRRTLLLNDTAEGVVGPLQLSHPRVASSLLEALRVS
jgi:predicted kinase